MLKYDKRNSGGRLIRAGVRVYTLSIAGGVGTRLTEPQPGALRRIPRRAIQEDHLWVRGEKGAQNFVVGLSDRHGRDGDFVKWKEIGK